MIKIGDFARIGGVNIATLRHYDEAGLIMPNHVDPATGYRYYGIGQLSRLHRILVLKELGLTLREIEILLRGALEPADMRRLLAEKRSDAEARIVRERERLRRIECRIAFIEKENTMPELEVIVKTVPAFTVASRRLHIPTNDQVGELLGAAYGEVMDCIHAQGGKLNGPCLAVWYSTPDMFTDEEVDAAFPLEAPIPGNERVQTQTLPETEVATVVHHGPFEEFSACHRALTQWLSDNGCRLDGPYREIYHSHGEEASTTEVQYPFARN
ncbi:MAG: MerR family transcriptional regulator [Fimbriimonas sp.]